MHKFIINNEVGQTRDFGSSERAAKLAQRIVGKDAVCAVQGNDVLWMLPQDVDYFLGVIGEFKVVNTAAALIAHTERAASVARTPADAERVRHAKFGLGSVVSRNRGEGKVVVKFDKQAKVMVMAESFLVAA